MIGILGGTFDPVHLAHLRVADRVRQRLGIDDFRMLPAGDPPHRQAPRATAGHRLEMLRLACRDWPGLAVDRREIDRAGPSYMVDTLGGLREEHPEVPLVLVIGQDAANGLDDWRRWSELPRLAHLVIAARPGQASDYSPRLRAEIDSRIVREPAALSRQPAGCVLPLDAGVHDLSSTAVRERLRAGQDTEGLLPGPVAAYIARHGLYR